MFVKLQRNQNTTNLVCFLAANSMNIALHGRNVGFNLDWSEKSSNHCQGEKGNVFKVIPASQALG